MKVTIKSLGVISVCVLAQSYSNAGTVVCSGTVNMLAYHSPNKLMLQLSSMDNPVFICNADSDWSVSGTTYTTGPGTCKAMYSTFLAAKSTGKTVSSVYFDGDQVPATCNGWGTWKNANIRYFSY